MPHEVIMPALGMAQDSGVLVAWHKAPGDPVAEGEVLFEVETDKAVQEVEAQAAGYLTGVRAEAGAEVPVGQVIARISDSPGDEDAVGAADTAAPAAPPPAAGAETEALPEGAEVIMPALGMAQDSGVLVAWHKAPGDPVAADDLLFEVETDKAVQEVEAGHAGHVAALLAEAGEEVPVGAVIAVISAEAPAAPVQRSRMAAPAAQPAAAAPKTAPEATAPAPAAPAAQPAAAAAPGGRILASPKARRLAREQGLDLARLAAAGHPQPYHVRDLEALKALPAEAPAAVATAGAAACHLAAETVGDGFAGFAAWAAETAGLEDAGALLAGFVAGALGRDAVVAVERAGTTRSYAATARLGAVTETDAAPELRLRDLRAGRITAARLGPEEVPVLTLTGGTGGLAVTLDWAPGQLETGAALTLIDTFAGRLEHPLRHLL